MRRPAPAGHAGASTPSSRVVMYISLLPSSLTSLPSSPGALQVSTSLLPSSLRLRLYAPLRLLVLAAHGSNAHCTFVLQLPVLAAYGSNMCG